MKWINLCFALLIFNALNLAAQTREVAITIYNDNLGVVKDQRVYDLPSGNSELKYVDVASGIDPTSVHFKSITAPDKVVILEQNYEFDLVDSYKILEKYLEKEVDVSTKEKTFHGKLLGQDNNNLILMNATGAVKLISKSGIINIDFPDLPEGLITRPTLVWKIQNSKKESHKTEVSYLTSGISWHAEYVAVVKDDDRKIDLSSWVSIDNKSGATYPDAKIKLVAGEVNRVTQSRPLRMEKSRDYVALAAAPQFEEKSFFEYHLYTLNRKATIKDNQIKQISFLPSTEVGVNKVYTYEPSKSAEDVRTNLSFHNSKKENLGIPLPAGKVRVYKEDPADGSLEFVGEDMIDHTPKDELVRLFLGNAFDIKPERNMLEKSLDGKKGHEERWQVKIRNHKEEAVSVLVLERLYGFWEVKNSTYPYTKKDGFTAQFKVDVPKDSEAVLEYTVYYSRVSN